MAMMRKCSIYYDGVFKRNRTGIRGKRWVFIVLNFKYVRVHQYTNSNHYRRLHSVCVIIFGPVILPAQCFCDDWFLHKHCVVVKFCFLLGKMGTETLEMLKTAYKDDTMGKFNCLSGFTVLQEEKWQLMIINLALDGPNRW